MRRINCRGFLFLLVLVSSLQAIFFGPTDQCEAAQSNPKIALVMKALSNPFFSAMEQGAKNYAVLNGVELDIFGVERETDVSQQIAILENLITQNYDAIILAPADSKRLLPVCKKARENNIVVINIDNPLHQPS